MVSKASEDLPEPESPVITTNLSRGISTEMFFRLCALAPTTRMTLCSMNLPSNEDSAIIAHLFYLQMPGFFPKQGKRSCLPWPKVRACPYFGSQMPRKLCDIFTKLS